jgi:hypothetical protein
MIPDQKQNPLSAMTINCPGPSMTDPKEKQKKGEKSIDPHGRTLAFHVDNNDISELVLF